MKGRRLLAVIPRGKGSGQSRKSVRQGTGSALALFSTCFFQLLGGTAGRAPEPAEEEHVQGRGKYIAEEGEAMRRLVAGVLFKGEDVRPAYAAFPGKGQGEVQDERQEQGAKAETDDLPAPFSVEEHQGSHRNGEEDGDEE